MRVSYQYVGMFLETRALLKGLFRNLLLSMDIYVKTLSWER